MLFDVTRIDCVNKNELEGKLVLNKAMNSKFGFLKKLIRKVYFCFKGFN